MSKVKTRTKTRTSKTTPLSLITRIKQETLNKYNNIQNQYLSNLTNYRWLRYIIALWTFRMIFVAIGFLIPILSLLQPEKVESGVFRLESMEWERSNLTFLKNVMEKEIPLLFHNAPVPNEDVVVDNLILSYLSTTLSNVKVSENGQFMYYSSEQAWSYKIPDNCTRLNDIPKDEFMKKLQQPQSNSTESYLYYNQMLTNPRTNHLLMIIAPYLVDIPSNIKGITPEFRLWLSSEGSVASPHYDMEHNFFLQVKGSKTFLIASPNLFKLFQPNSYLHPNWRQSKQSHLIDIDRICDIIMQSTFNCSCDVSEREGNLSQGTDGDRTLHLGYQCEDAFTVAKQPHHTLVEKKKKKKTDNDSISHIQEEYEAMRSPNADSGSTPHKDGHVVGSLYEVTLHPGDVLYIPPYYYHAVKSQTYSVSINTWVGSRYIVASDALKNIDLPYRDKSSPLAQVSAVAAMIKLVFLNMNNPIGMRYFASLMAMRQSAIEFEEVGDVDTCSVSDNETNKAKNICVDDRIPPCTLKSLKRAEQERIVHRAATGVRNVIAEYQLSVQILLLLDYVDDVFDLISSSQSSPKKMKTFIETCLNVQNYF